jgi:hypothetical protein
MAMSKHEERKEKKRELTPEEQAEQAQRDAQIERIRKYSWSAMQGSIPMCRRNDRRDPPPPVYPQQGQLSSAITPTAKLKPGWHDIVYSEEYENYIKKGLRLMGRRPDQIDEWEKEFEYEERLRHMDTLSRTMRRAVDSFTLPAKALGNFFGKESHKRLSIYVDENGNIRTEKYADMRNPREFRNVWTQVIRQYKLGLGSNRLSLDFPGTYDRNGSGKLDMQEVAKIDLRDILEKIKICERENPPVALYFADASATAARLANPKNKKEILLAKQIWERQKALEAKVNADPLLNKAIVETAHAFHADDLKKETADLKSKADGLKSATDAEKGAKLQELQSARAKLEKRLTSIEEDFKKMNPDIDTCKKYQQNMTDAKATLDALLKDADLSAKLPATDKQALVDLQKKTADLAQKVGNNALPPIERAGVKIDELKASQKAIEALLAELAKSPKDMSGVMKKLEQAMLDARGVVKGVVSERDPQKNNTKSEHMQYQAALNDLAQTMEKARNAVSAISDMPGRDDCVKACDESKVLVEDAAQDMGFAMKSREDRAEERLQNDFERLREMSELNAMDEILEHLLDIEEESDELLDQIKVVEKDLGKKDISEDQQENLSNKLKGLEEDKALLEQRRQIFDDQIKKISGPADPKQKAEFDKIKKSYDKNSQFVDKSFTAFDDAMKRAQEARDKQIPSQGPGGPRKQ